MKDQKVLVTGGTGFLGSYILRYLVREGYTNIIAIKRPTSQLALVSDIFDQITWVDVDILDVVTLANVFIGIDEVYHASAVVTFDEKNVDQLMKVNINGTANIINAALTNNIKKMLYVSSVAAIGRSGKNELISEETPWQKSKYNSKYSISKFQAELEVYRGISEGLNVAIINPSIIVGAGYWNATSVQLFHQIGNGLKIYPVGSNGFVDVRDVARFAILLMEQNKFGEKYIVCGDNLLYKKFFEMVADGINKPKPTLKLSPILAKFAAYIEAFRTTLLGGTSLITIETARTASHHFNYDNSKSKNIANFEYTSLHQTIQETGRLYIKSNAKQFNYAVLPLN